MIFNIMAVLIMLYSIKNLKKGLMLYLMFLVVGMDDAVFMKIGSKGLSIGLLMTIFFCTLYFIRRKKNKRFPYKRPFIVITTSMIITCFFGVAGFGAEFTRAINNIFTDVVFIWLIWQMLETKADLKFLIKGMSIIFLLTCLYGIFEYVTEMNPVVRYKSTLVDGGITLYSDTIEGATRGYRLISFMEHPIGAGMTLGLFFIFVLISKYYYKERYPKYYSGIAYVVAALCVLGAVLTKMRSALLFIIIGSLAVVDFKKVKFYKLVVAGAICAVLALPLYWKYVNLVLWMFSSRASKQLGGSSFQQRLGQLEACWNLLKMSPIGGLGERFKDYVNNEYTFAALGYESIWFEQMVKHGLVGVVANVYLAYFSVFKIPKKYKSVPAFFLGLAYWIIYTLTCIPAFRTPLYYTLMFYYIKKTDVYKKEHKMSDNRNDKKVSEKNYYENVVQCAAPM